MFSGFVFLSGVLLHLCDGSSVCKSESSTSGVTTTTYITCAETCCGNINDQYCCEDANSGLLIGVIATSVVFLILAIGLLICCMKNHSRKTTRVAVLNITEQGNAAARRDERRERRQRERAEALAGYPQQFMAGYPDHPPPSYQSMYGHSQPPGAYGEPSLPPGAYGEPSLPPGAYGAPSHPPPMTYNPGSHVISTRGAPSSAFDGAPSGAYGGSGHKH
ncbi:uncharacterized protein [Argopecten irradians]|uniref:uncharacterized protein n=1 Tax=Argopecten irradians TaxID=31199 RepID=UPI003712BADD